MTIAEPIPLYVYPFPLKPDPVSELQIRGGIDDNSKIFFLFLNENIYCHPSLNRLREMVLMMGHKICFYEEIWLIIPKLSL